MPKPKILVQRRKNYDDKGWGRYYTQIKLDLNISNFITEAQLLWFIYRNYGGGRYKIMAFLKGRKGFYVFWKGDINEKGYEFDMKRMEEVKEYKELQKEYEESEDEIEKSMIKEDMRNERDFQKNIKYGFAPYLKPSGRKGDFNFWGDFP